MSSIEVKELIEKKDHTFLAEYLNSLRTKLENLNNRIDRISLLLILIAVSYFLIQHSMISNINLGLVEISNFEIVLVAIPPIFAILLFYYVVLSAHKSEVYNTSKILAHFLFKDQVIDPADQFGTSDLVRRMLPFSLWEDIYKMNHSDKKAGCISVLLILPLFAFILFPLWFEYYALKLLILTHWHAGIHIKLSVILTIWVLLYTVFFYKKLFTHAIRK